MQGAKGKRSEFEFLQFFDEFALQSVLVVYVMRTVRVENNRGFHLNLHRIVCWCKMSGKQSELQDFRF